MKAFLLAAGLGTRLKPFTNSHPKALAKVNGQSLLERNIRFLKKSGIQDIVINVHHFAEQIIQAIQNNDGFGCKILISDETTTLLETGGGLKHAAPLLKGSDPILMMNVDILCDFDLKKMLEYHLRHKALATLAIQKRSSSRVLLFNSDNKLCGWRNNLNGEEKGFLPSVETTPQPYAFSGIQLLQQDFLRKIKQEGKFSIIDTYLDLCSTEKIIGWDHGGDLWLDVGKPESLETAKQIFKNQ